jgi:hypothetical protein
MELPDIKGDFVSVNRELNRFCPRETTSALESFLQLTQPFASLQAPKPGSWRRAGDLKMNNSEEPSEKFSQRDLKIGLAGLAMAAVLISLFLLLMTFLSHLADSTFANSLPR